MTRRTFETAEISALDASELGEVRVAESDPAMVLSEQDVMDLAKTIEPGHSAVVLAGENKWAALLRKAGGQLEGHRGERRRRGTGQGWPAPRRRAREVHRRPASGRLISRDKVKPADAPAYRTGQRRCPAGARVLSGRSGQNPGPWSYPAGPDRGKCVGKPTDIPCPLFVCGRRGPGLADAVQQCCRDLRDQVRERA